MLRTLKFSLKHLCNMLCFLSVGLFQSSLYGQTAPNAKVPDAAAEPPYSISIVPQFPALEIYRHWTPVLEHLQRATGMRFELKILPTIPEFERDFLGGRPDIVYLNPYHAVMAYKAHGYIPVIRDGKEMLSGVLVVRADSPLKSVQELNHQFIAFPAPNAFGASLYMRALLAREFHLTIQPQYVRTHSNSYRAVISKQVAAAGGVETTLMKENENIRQQLRVLYETPGVPAHPISIHPRIPLPLRAKIQRAFLSMEKTPASAELLKNIQIHSPVTADYQRDYAPLEQLGLEKFMVLENTL